MDQENPKFQKSMWQFNVYDESVWQNDQIMSLQEVWCVTRYGLQYERKSLKIPENPGIFPGKSPSGENPGDFTTLVDTARLPKTTAKWPTKLLSFVDHRRKVNSLSNWKWESKSQSFEKKSVDTAQLPYSSHKSGQGKTALFFSGHKMVLLHDYLNLKILGKRGSGGFNICAANVVAFASQMNS